ncbi:MAG: aldo/keto reductase, partial [Myxococcota bacterium]|nr:aldo/keto reductase [Myxococcota bacterium]
ASAPIATRHGATLSQIALAWVLARSGVTAVIAGASSEAQARQNADAARIILERAEIALLDSTFRKVRVDREWPRRSRLVSRVRRVMRRALG